MPLTPGTRLGPCEITAPLGAGGMGGVFRATDTRLGREGAVKVLPQHLSVNPEVRALRARCEDGLLAQPPAHLHAVRRRTRGRHRGRTQQASKDIRLILDWTALLGQ